MDFHFDTDLMVYVGVTHDVSLHTHTGCPTCAIPVAAAMSIAQPFHLWTVSAIQKPGHEFIDVDISNDGKKVVLLGFNQNRMNDFLCVLNSTDGS